MSPYDLLRKLVADLRAGDVKTAAGTLLQLFALFFGQNPISPTPNPNSPISTMATASADECNAAADKVQAFIDEHDKPGAKKFGDGVLLGKFLELVKLLAPLLIGLKP